MRTQNGTSNFIIDMATRGQNECALPEGFSSGQYKCCVHTDTSPLLPELNVRELLLRPGFSMTLIRNCPATPCPLPFKFKESPLVFAVGLSGSGSIRFQGEKKEIRTAEQELYVAYAPHRQGLSHALQNRPFSGVSLMFDRGFVTDLLGPGSMDDLPRALGKEALRGTDFYAATLPTPPKIMALGHKLLGSNPRPELFPVFAYSTGLEMLCLIMDHLLQIRPSTEVSLSRDDVDRLHAARLLMERNMAEPPSFQAICRDVGLNEFKLKRGFKQVFGTTLFGYLQQQRVTTAYLSMVNDGKSVSECAWDVGYTNVGHFITAFKKHFGVTPGEVRRGYRVQAGQ